MRVFAVALLTCVLAHPAFAQDTPLAAFEAVDAEMTKVNVDIEAVIKQYRTAPAGERQAIFDQYNALAEKARKILPRLQKTTLAAYRADPKASPRVEERMIGLLADDVRQDRYDEAMVLVKLLAESGCTLPALDTFAGLAAYSVDNFIAAETHLQKAEAAGALTREAQGALQDLATAKEVWIAEQAIRAKEAKADDLPRVKFETAHGSVVIELYENEAPGAVGNFVSLVEDGYYDGLTFHRVLPGFMAQGGCPDGTGTGGPGYNIACECQQDNHRKHFRGTLSMAHAGRDTGGSQFFLTFKRTPHLDGRHTVFGRVIEGHDVLAKLQRRDPSGRGALPEPDKIVKAEVIRKRDHAYVPNKVK